MINKLYIPTLAHDMKVSFAPGLDYFIFLNHNQSQLVSKGTLEFRDGNIVVVSDNVLLDMQIYAAGGDFDHQTKIFTVKAVGIIAALHEYFADKIRKTSQMDFEI